MNDSGERGGMNGGEGTMERAAGTGKVTGQVMGDRVCSVCGFNLHGQQIVREEHYGMLIVRCPECSATAALEEYPSLGKWAGRLSFLTASVFLLGMVALFFVSSALIAGFAASSQNEQITSIARLIAVDHLSHQQKVQTPAAPPQGAPAAYLPYAASNLRAWEYDAIELAWWDATDQAKYRPAPTVLWTEIDRKMGVEALMAGMFAVGIGCAWAVALCGLSRRRLWLIVVAIGIGSMLAIAITLMTGQSVLWGYSNGPGWKTASLLAREFAILSGAWKFLAFEIAMVRWAWRWEERLRGGSCSGCCRRGMWG